MIKTRRRPWPRPADTAVDRARCIAREYRAALATEAPDRCAALDQAAVELGETWITGAPQHTDAELLTLTDLAAALGEKYGTVWQWWKRGRIPREHSGLFRLDAVLDGLARWRVERETAGAGAVVEVPSAPDDLPVRDPAATSISQANTRRQAT